ncbi:MAG: D-3-phosphoglycerate dehydrogenase [Chloroflexi bacterium ADurb.Bin222]|nr:MAG: D-3-phosphoglycerate dehydrogenase [Chloroflexi bacterium ADurb.Bin222]
MAKILICDPVDAEAIAQMREAGLEVDVRDTISLEELEQVLNQYDGMVVRSRTKVRQPLIDAAPNLKLIVRGGVGLDTIDVDYARSKGITVLNTPAANSAAVAELVIGLMLTLARHITLADATMKAGKWEKKALEGTEIAGKTLGLIGYGRIGRLTAQKARALGMNVVGYDPFITINDAGVRAVELEELLKISDYISLHVPTTPQTRGMVSTAQFAQMKPTAYVINAARGGVVDEAALYTALVNKVIAGAALDVYTEEPPKSEGVLQLIALPQVVALPHLGASTVEALGRVGGEVAALVIEHFKK